MPVRPELIDEILDRTVKLCAIPSPSGMTAQARDYLVREFESLGYEPVISRKGAVVVHLGGEGHHVSMAAHVDTLGAMVRSIKPTGRLRLTNIGGFALNAIESENCLIHTRDGRKYSGCVQLTQASRHVFPDHGKQERTDQNVEVVIDEKVFSDADVRSLGIRAGDFVTMDPRTVVTPSGFLKSRHIDDKACVGLLLVLARLVKEGEVKLARKVSYIFTSYEEVGHGGASSIPSDVEDILVVDMGAVGDDLETNEFKVSICAKDSSGPFDHELTTQLVRLAEREELNFAVDVYPSYTSDVAVALRAGYDARHALIGPGVFASHGYERTHREGLENTLELLMAFVADRPGSAA